MHLIIVSGLSGSGKSTALRVLEDVGFNCIDNLPVSLLPALIAQVQTHPDSADQKFAIGIDVRNAWRDLNLFPDTLDTLRKVEVDFQVFFLDTRSAVLMQRFSETRRKHPLSDKETNLEEAILAERSLVEPIRDAADQVLDTSNLTLHELRDLVKERVAPHETSMAILFESFGFKHGLPINADLVFDSRCLPNPHWKAQLRPLTGKDRGVINFLEREPTVTEMYGDIEQYLTQWLPRYQANNRSYITIAIGCTGGQHRSVYLCEKLYSHFVEHFDNVQVRHRDINNHHAN